MDGGKSDREMPRWWAGHKAEVPLTHVRGWLFFVFLFSFSWNNLTWDLLSGKRIGNYVFVKAIFYSSVGYFMPSFNLSVSSNQYLSFKQGNDFVFLLPFVIDVVLRTVSLNGRNIIKLESWLQLLLVYEILSSLNYLADYPIHIIAFIVILWSIND